MAAPPPETVAADRPARVLLAALVACLLYAAFAGGAVDAGPESRVQLGLLGAAGVAAVVSLRRGGLALGAAPLAWTGVGLLAAFAAWSGLSLAWSVAPDRSWAELNRGVATVLAVLLGIGLGASSARGRSRACGGLALVGGLAALYALAGKTIPGVSLGGLLDLDQAGELTRLRAPLGYWNALGLLCVLATGPAVAVALDATRPVRTRLTALCATAVLLAVLVLTYSRGGLAALAVALGVLLLAGRAPARVLAAVTAAAFAAVGPVALALSRPDLTTDALPLARREDDALLVGLVLLAALAGLCAVGRIAMRREGGPGPGRDRLALRLAAGAVLVAVLAVVVGAAASPRGLGGTVSDAVTRFKGTGATGGRTDPGRISSTDSGNRWVWWNEAAGAWSDRPLAGWGAGSFPVTHRRYRTVPLSVQQPHSMPMQWLAETGLVGFLLAAGAVLCLLGAALARVRAVPPGPERLAGAALAAAGAAWAVHALYDWDWDIPGVTLPMFVALGVAVARPAAARPRRAHGSRVAASIAVAVAVLVAGISALLPALSAARTAAALDAAGGDDASPRVLADAARAADLGARLDPTAVEPLFASASIAVRRGDLAEARRQLGRAVERQPESSDAWARLARLDLLRGDRPGLREAVDRLVVLDPRSPALLALAERAQTALTPPAGSGTATGSPLAP